MTDTVGSDMLLKAGVDICSIARIRNVYQKYGEKFLHRILTEREAHYVRSSQPHLITRLAARFAAKEAMAKVLGTGMVSVSWKEIEVGKAYSGEPSIILHRRAKARAEKIGLNKIALSISHEKEYAVAFIVAM